MSKVVSKPKYLTSPSEVLSHRTHHLLTWQLSNSSHCSLRTFTSSSQFRPLSQTSRGLEQPSSTTIVKHIYHLMIHLFHSTILKQRSLQFKNFHIKVAVSACAHLPQISRGLELQPSSTTIVKNINHQMIHLFHLTIIKQQSLQFEKSVLNCRS